MTAAEIALFSVAIPALVALLTSLGTTFLTHHFSSAREEKDRLAKEEQARRTRRREKLEEMVAQVLQAEDDTSRRHLAIGAKGLEAALGVTLDKREFSQQVRLDPFELAHATQMLYFPSLGSVFLKLMEGRQESARFVSEQASLISTNIEKWKTEHQLGFGTRSAASLATLQRGIHDLRVGARQIMEQEKLA